jgi:hypothetical protein
MAQYLVYCNHYYVVSLFCHALEFLMIKFFVSSLIFFIFVSFFSLSQASPITNLTSTELEARNYINAEDKLSASLLGVNYITRFGYDWAWASPVNVESYVVNAASSLTNTLYGPGVQKNWTFASDDLLKILREQLFIEDFTATDGSGTIIQAAQFFNSYYEDVNVGDFNTKSSQFNSGSSMFNLFETFYVRPSQVPEPSTLMIFALGLIALVSKKKLFS